MPLDWDIVRQRYGKGMKIPTVAGGKLFEVTGVDERGVYIRNSLWQDVLAREHLAKAVELVEARQLSDDAGHFVEQYRAVVADVRVTSAAHVLKDLGYLH